jgi:polyisoprenoid-binding protein YceI
VGHDLELAATALSVEVDEASGAVEVRVDARAIRLRGARTPGSTAVAPISAGDTRTIEGHLWDDVLEVARFPEIHFVGKLAGSTPSGGHIVDGQLTLHGVTRALQLRSERSGDSETAEVGLEQSEFGIKPFRAMLGALRVRSRVVIKLRLTLVR